MLYNAQLNAVSSYLISLTPHLTHAFPHESRDNGGVYVLVPSHPAQKPTATPLSNYRIDWKICFYAAVFGALICCYCQRLLVNQK